MTTLRALGLATLALLIAAPVLAGGYDHPKPPPPPPYEPEASYRVCGDPRLLVRLDNRDSAIWTRYEIRFRRSGSDTRTTRFVTVPPGRADLLYPHWVLGRSYLRVIARPAPGFVYPAIWTFPKLVLIAERIEPAVGWGRGDCPVSLPAARWLARTY